MLNAVLGWRLGLGLGLGLLGLMTGCGVSEVYFAPTSLTAAAGTTTGPAPTGTTSGGTTGGSGITVSTLAGNGILGNQDGSGGRNGTAQFGWPMGVGVDLAGNVYVADARENNIREIDPQGNVTTFAGNGEGHQDGTGGPNGTAQFFGPVALAVGPSRDVFVADTGNSLVRIIDPFGDVTTLPIQQSNGVDFNGVGAIAVGPDGTLFVADTNNQRICAIDPGGKVRTVAGNQVAGYVDGYGLEAEFDNPYGLTVDQYQNVYVGDSANNLIRKIDPTTGNVTTFAGSGVAGFADGPADQAQFNLPSGLAMDVRGNLLVVDCNNNRIRSIDPNGNVTTLAGSGAPGDSDGSGGPNGEAEFNHPFGIAVDALGNIYVGGNEDSRVRKIVIP